MCYNTRIQRWYTSPVDVLQPGDIDWTVPVKSHIVRLQLSVAIVDFYSKKVTPIEYMSHFCCQKMIGIGKKR